MELMDLVKIPIVIGIVVVLKIIKSLLDKRNIRFKDEDSWLWITLISGIPMAAISQGIDGWGAFNIYQFIVNSFLYSAAACIVYKIYKVGGKQVEDIMRKK